MGTTKKHPRLMLSDLVVGKVYTDNFGRGHVMTYLGQLMPEEKPQDAHFIIINGREFGYVPNQNGLGEDVYSFYIAPTPPFDEVGGLELHELEEDEPQPTKEEQTIYDGVVTEHNEEALEVIKNGFPFELGKNYNYGRRFAGKFVGYDKVGDPLFENKKNKEKWGVVGEDRLVTLFNEGNFTLIEDND